MTHTTKHTPGPWVVEQCSAPVYGSDGSIIAEGIGIGTQSTHIGTVYGKNNAHNATLIAAAPAMYEALRRIKVLMESGDIEGKDWMEYGQIVQALAQAEGTHV